jgi:hypothetical protein
MPHYAGVDWATRTHAVCVVDAFLTQADLAEATRREYGKYLSRLATRLGADRPLATITADELEAAITDLWGATKPRTWNQRLAVVGSFLAFVRWRGWPMAPASDLTLNLDRRRVKVDRTRVPTPTELERFWAKQHIPLMVKVFTRLQYETAARATELLSADIADLNMDNRRLRVTSKGGDIEWVYFQSGSARNLPRLLRGRTSGPLFVTRLRPGPARPLPPTSARHRAGQVSRVKGAQTPSPERDLARQRAVLDAFLAASRAGDFEVLVAVLHPEVVVRADFSPSRPRRSAVTRGAAAVARQALQGARPAAPGTPGPGQRCRRRHPHHGRAALCRVRLRHRRGQDRPDRRGRRPRPRRTARRPRPR